MLVQGYRLSIDGGKAQIVKRDVQSTPVANVKNGLATEMRGRGLLYYNGGHELTIEGKRRGMALLES